MLRESQIWMGRQYRCNSPTLLRMESIPSKQQQLNLGMN